MLCHINIIIAPHQSSLLIVPTPNGVD
jgi:hypothetical protein